MISDSRDRAPQREVRQEKQSIRKFLSDWCGSISDDRQLLNLLDEASRVMSSIPPNEPIALEKIAEQLNTSTSLSPGAKGLIPFVMSALSKVERNEDIEVPKENRAYRNALLHEVNAYDDELCKRYNNEQHGFDTRRSDILDLIYTIHDEEQDDYALIERRAQSWPDIIRPRIIERAMSEGKLDLSSLEAIIDEVLPEIHKRTLIRVHETR